MASQLDPKEVISFEELLRPEIIQSEALINLFEKCDEAISDK